MPMKLKEVVISKPGDHIRRAYFEVPDYVQRAIEESIERGKRDAKLHGGPPWRMITSK
jgi:hypothetical protein